MTEDEKTILVVDDDPYVLRFAVRALTSAGYNVLAADNGEHALAIFQNTPTISLLLTDIKMPGMDGIQLAATVLKMRPELPLLFASGCCNVLPVETECGCLRKPFTGIHLLSRVAECLNNPQTKRRVAAAD